MVINIVKKLAFTHLERVHLELFVFNILADVLYFYIFILYNYFPENQDTPGKMRVA